MLQASVKNIGRVVQHAPSAGPPPDLVCRYSSDTAVRLLQASVKNIGRVVQCMPSAELLPELHSPDLLPGLFEAFDHHSADVRKAVTMCLMYMWQVGRHYTKNSWLADASGQLDQALLKAWLVHGSCRSGGCPALSMLAMTLCSVWHLAYLSNVQSLHRARGQTYAVLCHKCGDRPSYWCWGFGHKESAVDCLHAAFRRRPRFDVLFCVQLHY